MKIIKIEACIYCQNFKRDYDRSPRINYCEETGLRIENKDVGKVNQDCPLEDYQKTEWLPISEMKKNVEYWFIDGNNVVGVGHLEQNRFIVYDLSKTLKEFDVPVMFSEIKPPEVSK